MPHIADEVFDSGLNDLVNNADRIDICSQEPANYTEATSTYSLGNETTISVTGPSAKSGGGREVDVGAVSGASVIDDGTAANYAVSYVTGTRMQVAGDLSATQAVSSGNTFDLSAFKVGIPDAT